MSDLRRPCLFRLAFALPEVELLSRGREIRHKGELSVQGRTEEASRIEGA
jgi:hypothetical protein